MLVPCETASRSLVPALRALLAKELMQNHGLKQTEVAKILGITQTAVSKYVKHVRGSIPEITDVAEIRLKISEIAVLLADGKMPMYGIAKHICMVCQIVRKKRLMCEVCKKYNPSIDSINCNACMEICKDIVS